MLSIPHREFFIQPLVRSNSIGFSQFDPLTSSISLSPLAFPQNQTSSRTLRSWINWLSSTIPRRSKYEEVLFSRTSLSLVSLSFLSTARRRVYFSLVPSTRTYPRLVVSKLKD